MESQIYYFLVGEQTVDDIASHESLLKEIETVPDILVSFLRNSIIYKDVCLAIFKDKTVYRLM